MEAGESTIGIVLGIDGDVDGGGTELGDDGVEVGDSEVDHPVFFGIAEVIGVVGKGGEDGGSSFLGPGFLVVIGRDEVDSEMVFIPLGEGGGILGAEEEAADAGDVVARVRVIHRVDLINTRALAGDNTQKSRSGRERRVVYAVKRKGDVIRGA